MRLPIRARLTLISTVLMAVVLAAAGALILFRLRADLIESVDVGLRSRAGAIVGRVELQERLARGGLLIEPEETFAQVLESDGTVLESSPALRGDPLLEPAALSGLNGARFSETTIRVAEESLPVRLLAISSSSGRVVIVASSLEELREATGRLAILMWVGGAVALVLAAGVAWVVAGAALRPVERLRSEASAISADEATRRLAVPQTGDELAHLAETLNEMLDRLGDALERERRFVGDASHELRTPLANLRAEIELALRRSRGEEELMAALRSAGHETERLVRLAEDLLVLARAERGRLPVSREPVDVAALVGSEVSAFSQRASERGIQIELHVLNTLRFDMDPQRLRQALGNLLDNAIRHSPPGGTVSVEARSEDGGLALEVADQGEGFVEDFLPQAFEPFARADLSRSRDQGGSGLGLAIVRAVAEAHGGTAEARNLPERGASVIVTMRP